jgi:tetratricopeptide (TPR) repeat protein
MPPAHCRCRLVKDPILTLNSAWLRNRVAELGLKQWWLAEQVSVDKKTVIRWMHGHVRKVQPGNAAALASVLGCSVEDLALPRDAVDLATADDQRAAAALLATSTLLDKLGPVGEWDVIESLLKAVAVPDLPLHVLGTIYNQLAIACWRQGKLDQSEVYNRAAFDAAQRCGDQALLAGALATRANLLHWRGECAQAQQHWREGLALRRFLEPIEIAALHNNLGMDLCETGEFEAGERELLAARDLYRLAGTPMQRSINHGALAILALRRGDAGAARPYAEAAAAHAERGDYRRGIAMGALVLADIHARGGENAAALDALAYGKAAFARLGIEEGLNLEFEGRVLRLLGRADEACVAIEEGLRLAAKFPVEAAWLQHEFVLTHQARGDTEAAQVAAGRAIEWFDALGAPRMIHVGRAMVAGMSPRVPGRTGTQSLP